MPISSIALLSATVIGFVSDSASSPWRMEKLDTTVSNFYHTSLSVEGHPRGERFFERREERFRHSLAGSL